MAENDILHVTSECVEFNTDSILVMNGSSSIPLMVHCSRYIGTLAMFAAGRPDLQAAPDKALRFEISQVPSFTTSDRVPTRNTGGSLTEVDHGLDARNLETTATLVPDGSFDLHTPHRGTAKLISFSCSLT